MRVLVFVVLAIALVAPTAAVADTLVASTFAGGRELDDVRAVGTDPNGDAILVGYTTSDDLHATAGAAATDDVADHYATFVARVSPSGGLGYLALLGGPSGFAEQPWAGAVDSAGNAYAAGETAAPNFPTTPDAFQPRYPGGRAGFVTKLDRTGAIVWSTYLGADARVGLDGFTSVLGMTADADGRAIVVGSTSAENRGGADAFVAKFDDAGGLIWLRRFAGQYNDAANAVAADGHGGLVVVGDTNSAEFPVTAGAYKTTYDRGDAFVTALSSADGTIRWSTFLGGSPRAAAVAIDPSGAVYVGGGSADPSHFATPPGAMTTVPGALGGGFVCKLRPDGSGIVYATLIGSSPADFVSGIALDGSGRAWAAGRALSANLPTTANGDTARDNFQDGFLLRLRPDGSGIDFGTYLGGAGGPHETANAVAAAPGGRAWVAGVTDSADFPVTAGAWRTTGQSGSLFDGFASLVDPAGASWRGGAPTTTTTTGAGSGGAGQSPGPGPAADRRAPALRARMVASRFSARRGRADVRITLDERATVTVSVRRVRGRRTVAAGRHVLRAAAGVSHLRFRVLRGAYRATVIATDPGGNRSRAITLHFTATR